MNAHLIYPSFPCFVESFAVTCQVCNRHRHEEHPRFARLVFLQYLVDFTEDLDEATMSMSMTVSDLCRSATNDLLRLPANVCLGVVRDLSGDVERPIRRHSLRVPRCSLHTRDSSSGGGVERRRSLRHGVWVTEWGIASCDRVALTSALVSSISFARFTASSTSSCVQSLSFKNSIRSSRVFDLARGSLRNLTARSTTSSLILDKALLPSYLLQDFEGLFIERWLACCWPEQHGRNDNRGDR